MPHTSESNIAATSFSNPPAPAHATSPRQVELARLVEANAKLRRKLDACDHNVDETKESIEDLELQLARPLALNVFAGFA